MTTTPATQALLSVTPEEMNIRAEIWNTLGNDRKMGKALIAYGMVRFSNLIDGILARHRQAHSLPGDVGTDPERLARAMNPPLWVEDEETARKAASPLQVCSARARGIEAAKLVLVELAALTPSALSGDAGEGWQNIASAPKNGTHVVIWVDGMEVTASFDEDEKEWFNGKWGLGFSDVEGPTHWRVRSDPPKEGAGE